MPQRKICCLLAISATFFVLQSKEAKQWLLAQQQRHIHSFHRQMFCRADFLWVFTLHYCSITLEAEIIRYHSQFLQRSISTSNCFSQIHSILWKLCKDSQCWHTSWRASGFMTSLSNPPSSSVSSWLMPGSTSWCTFPRVDTRQLCSTAPHLYNSKGLRALLLQCWKTHYVYFCQLLGSLRWGGPGSNWATLHEMKPQD